MAAQVAVAMSGGVDSSVAAARLVAAGFQVEGIYMKNWSPRDDQSLTDCPWQQDQDDAAAVCAQLGIPFRSVNFEREYQERVVATFLAEYAAGRTPNPDILCNREVKFDLFLAKAKALGFDYMATGHYVQTVGEGEKVALLRGKDRNKDQSYFLYTLTSDQLRDSRFPIGELTKEEVRTLAADLGLATAAKRDSQGICFIGHIDFKKYLQEQIPTDQGYTYLVGRYNGEVSIAERCALAQQVGEHRGSMYYTIGERAGACIDNRRFAEVGETNVPPVYVLAKDHATNALYVTESHDDPQLSAYAVTVREWRWTGGISEKSPSTQVVERLSDSIRETALQAQVRYRQRETVIVSGVTESEAGIRVQVDGALWAVSPGQHLVIYADDRVVGGGVVESSEPATAIHSRTL